MKNRFILFFFFLALGLPTMAMADSQSIIINEIAWMGTTASANDEWIELYNNSAEEVNLDGWVLKAEDGVPEINLTGQIPANGFYLLERTDDETIPGVAADLIYAGALENSREYLKLYDGSGNLVDEVNCRDGWLAGDNGTKLTMERTDSGWQNSQEPGGTPRKENYELRIMNYEEKLESENLNQNEGAKLPGQPLPEEIEGAKLLEKETPIEYPRGIVFTKIMPSPEGPDETEEWIEIYNSNDSEVDLSGWQIKDIAGKITTYTLNTKIKELSSFRLSRPETKITLNNDGDGLELLNPQGEVVDSVDFTKALQGQAYIKTSSGWSWESSLAPFKASEETKGAKLQEQSLPAQNKEANLLDIGLKEKNKSLVPMFIAVIVAVFSAGTVLILKKYINPVRG